VHNDVQYHVYEAIARSETQMKLPFTAVARRDLKFATSKTFARNVVLAISLPYSPPKTPMGLGEVACMVLTCDDPEMTVEVSGKDELEVLQKALLHIEKFVDVLAADKTGKLLNKDGTPFERQNVTLFARLLARPLPPAPAQAKKIKRRA